MSKSCRLSLVAGLALSIAWLPEHAFAQVEQTNPDPNSTTAPIPDNNMDEALRASVRKVVVLPTPSPYPPTRSVTGSYRDETPGLVEGSLKGAEIGKGVGTEIGGIPIGIPFPILTLPGAIIGGISGETKQQIQEFRDRMTEDLRDAANHPLTNDALATNVFWGLKRLPGLDTKVLALNTAIPEDTDAVLYVSITDLAIDVQGKEALITTSASATLRRLSDGTDLFFTNVQYQDRDSLSNWTENESALWRTYSNFARQYIGREISARVFDRISLTHELRPSPTGTVKLVKGNAWQGQSKSKTPTLAWTLELGGGDAHAPWADSIGEDDIFYDIEIYDRNRPVYSAKRLPEPEHTIDTPLEPCKSYRWSVRPAYHVGNDTRFGDWMRVDAGLQTKNGMIGKAASAAPAYIYDFATLSLHCKAR
jgi:hypothetical protein